MRSAAECRYRKRRLEGIEADKESAAATRKSLPRQRKTLDGRRAHTQMRIRYSPWTRHTHL